ncbi:MAG: DUF861 domain-containing protein [Propionibacterium sp.]|nr:DUF861 domain-containing protein [Propionibacterium sp.]
MPASTRRALTAADVRAAAEQGTNRLQVAAGTIVTPLARDTARELDVALVPASTSPDTPRPGGDGGSLEDRVRRIVAGVLAVPEANAALDGNGHPDRIVHVDGREVALEPFPYPGPAPGQDVRSADVVTAAHGSPVAAGFLTLTKGSFPWTLTYDEVQYVIEGELHIGGPDGTVVGRPGDVLYIPRGTSITFGTPTWARFLYVTHPADWEASLP